MSDAKPPVDWTQPLEAHHRDGRVVPVELYKDWPHPDKDGDYLITTALDGRSIFKADGTHYEELACPWRIRNRQPAADTVTIPRMTEAEALGLWGQYPKSDAFVEHMRQLGLIRPESTPAEQCSAATGIPVASVQAVLDWQKEQGL